MNNFDRSAPAPQNPQQIYAVARVNIAFVIAPDFYVQIRAKPAPERRMLLRWWAKNREGKQPLRFLRNGITTARLNK
ncbi:MULTISPECIES: hypothetical protein [Pantoea]|uniref:hypothetical protein n=1 Tax=Pantoea TaxID=53335 RepID=UPI0011C46AF5|nr:MULTISPECIES: hypothetical protein [Pantoea]MBZ6385341.1 hypothetical protein [Pantoea piersonii]MBZ6401155.1 hypothetical protein [Pantoea piersonii]MBZ6408855.1 hypothetical protein [Pantoea piersonii]MBZ6427754.1 hypothetical protein [Pantoea piersonii]NYB03933.1 hypothetical protein [Pantoea piersonii]